MQICKIAGLAALVGVLCSGSYVLGQATQPFDIAQYEKDMRDAESDLATGEWQNTLSGADKTTILSVKAVGNSTYARVVAKQVLARYYSGDTKALARLQALQVMQNARMIELLERSASRDK